MYVNLTVNPVEERGIYLYSQNDPLNIITHKIKRTSAFSIETDKKTESAIDLKVKDKNGKPMFMSFDEGGRIEYLPYKE